REFLPELCGEQKSRIGRDARDPLAAMLGAYRLVKRCVDFDGVEKFGEIRGLVEASRLASRIDDPGPIRVGPSRRADANRPRSSLPIFRRRRHRGWEKLFALTGLEC